MLRNIIAVLLVMMSLPQPAVAASDVILAKLQNPKIVGEGVLTYAFWDVYKATLYAPDGQWDARKPFVLSIEYYRDIKGAAIADRSVQEIRRQGFSDEIILAAWHSQMKAIFPDVQNGTTLSAAYIPGKETIFYRNGKRISAIKGDAFASHFFAIWLGQNTSEPSLRQALLGRK